MRKFADVFLVLLLAFCSVFASYFVAEKAVKTDRSTAQLATVSKVAATEKDSDRILLCENKREITIFISRATK